MPKYYVVWKGRKPGVYSNWASCAEQVLNFPNARYKGYLDRDEAYAAYGKDKSHKEVVVGIRGDGTKVTVDVDKTQGRLSGGIVAKPLLKNSDSGNNNSRNVDSELITRMRIILDRIVSELTIWRMRYPDWKSPDLKGRSK